MSQATNKTADADNNGRNKSIAVPIIVALALVVIAMGAVIGFLLGRNGNSGAESERETRQVTDSVRTVVDEESARNVMDEMREEVVEGMFECQMSMNWTFDNGAAESKDAYVSNSVNNTHPILFDVYLNDTQELLYSSPVLPVGTSLTNFKLDKELPAGTYKATVMYQLLTDVETQETVSAAGFVVTIQVLN
jgi:hypothetical protein